MVNMKKIALFAAGTLFGSAGFKLLSSSDAKKVYTQPRLRPLSSRTLLRRLHPPRLPNNPRPYGSRLRAALFHGQKGNKYEMHYFA